MLQLWCHETFRIIGDRMWDPTDRTWLKGQLDDKLKAIFGTTWDELFGEGKDCLPFVSFMRNSENPPYEPVTDFVALKVGCISICACLDRSSTTTVLALEAVQYSSSEGNSHCIPLKWCSSLVEQLQRSCI